MRTARLVCSALLAAALPLFGCAHEDAAEQPHVGLAWLSSAEIEAQPLNDAQVADVLRAGFVAAMDESRMIAGTASHPEVAAFARRMYAEYDGALDEERNILGDRHTSFQTSHESESIALESKTAEEAISTLPGPSQERAYLAREVVRQRELLNLIDQRLLPSVRSEDQKNEMLRVRPIIAAMLAQSSQMETWLRGRG